MGFINQSGLIIQHLGLRKNLRQYLTVNTLYADFLTNFTFVLCVYKKICISALMITVNI